MNIENNIIKHYLRNVLFINGTAYAGKSTMCRLLAEKYNLYHCEENYNSETIFSVINAVNQPGLSYFESKESWQAYLNRSPKAFAAWFDAVNEELKAFEIAELIKISQDRKVIVDTNIPINDLLQIANYNQIAVMLSPQSLSVDSFFDRSDPEKQFLLSEIMKSSDPEATLSNFKACIAETNSVERYNHFAKSGCYTLIRESKEEDTLSLHLGLLENHFMLKPYHVDIRTEHFFMKEIMPSESEALRVNIFTKEDEKLIGSAIITPAEIEISLDENYDSSSNKKEIRTAVSLWSK